MKSDIQIAQEAKMEPIVKIAEKQGIKLNDSDLNEMLKEIEVSYLERKLAEQLEDKKTNPIQKVVEKVTSSLETISPIK